MNNIFENLIVPKRILNGDAAERNAGPSHDTPEHFEFPELDREEMTRREFIKMIIAFLGGVAIVGFSTYETNDGRKEDRKEEFDVDHLPYDFWFTVMTKIYERFGDDPSPMQIRAHAIIRALGIPSGQVSALTSTQDAVRTDSRTDEVLAKCLTNDAGVEIMPEHITSSDILDLYPKGLPEEMKKSLAPETVEMLEMRYVHAKELYERFGDVDDVKIALGPESYFRLPGGIDLVSVGYTHGEKYQDIHGDYLERLSLKSAVIVIEGFYDRAYGTSLVKRYNDNNASLGYDSLMHRAIQAGYRGIFAEVDARDREYVDIDPMIPFADIFYPLLVSDEFRRKYFDFIKKENPPLFRQIGSESNFEHILSHQLTMIPDKRQYHHARLFINRRPVNARGEYVSRPEGFEFGQILFADALSAIKLHLIARLMADQKMKKGPILDIQGSAHLSGKSFFLRYPEYAMEVILRNLPELLAARGKNGISDLDKQMERPDWSMIIRQIVDLGFSKMIEIPTVSESIDRMEAFSVDFLGEYGIDPKNVIPSDEEVQEIMEKTRHGRAMRKTGKKRE